MPWVRFARRFDFKPTPRVLQTFAADTEKLVTTPCAKAAIADGAAVAIPTPPRRP